MSNLLLLVYPAVLVLSFIYLYKRIDDYRDIVNKNVKTLLVFVFAVFVIGNLAIILYFSIEDCIYFWDYSGFWTKTIDYLSFIKLTGLRNSLNELYVSMNNYEHSYLLCLFLSLPMRIFGETFSVFVMSVFNMFVIPIAINLYIIIKRLIPNTKNIIIYLTIGLFLPLYSVLFKGYADVAGLFFITSLIISVTFIKSDNLGFVDILFIAVNCFILIFLRRWYLFWIIAFFAVFGFIAIVIEKSLKKILILFCSGLLLLSVVSLFFRPYLFRLLTNNMSVAYSAYKIDGVINEIISYIHFYGLFSIVLCIIGVALSIYNKNKQMICFGMLMLVIIVMFSFIQSFDEHHFHLINISVLIYIAYAISLFDKKIQLIVIILMLINFVHPFLKNNLIHSFLNIIFTNTDRQPVVLTYKNDLEDFVDYISSICSDNEYIYFASSSLEFNADVLRNIKLPYVRNAVPNMINTSDVDLRDGFPKNFKYITYVITVNPTQYHMRDINDQYINYLINDAVQNVESISKYYKEIHKTNIDGKEFKIYKRINDLDNDAIEYFRTKITERYPNNPELLNGID